MDTTRFDFEGTPRMSSDQRDTIETICPYCGVGVASKSVRRRARRRPLSALGQRAGQRGRICIKGGAATEVVDHEDRLTDPLIRDDGEFREATWEEAYEYVVSELERIRDQYGPDAMGFSASKTMNEENYLLQKLARRYGTNNVDNCTRMCHASTVWALRTSLGAGR